MGAICAIILDKKSIRKGSLKIGLLFGREVGKEVYHKTFSEFLEKLNVEKDNLTVEILDTAPALIAYKYLKEGTVLYCDDKNAFKRFKAAKISQYLEMKDEMQVHAAIALRESESLSE